MKPRKKFEFIRFHTDFGPESLFERVRFKMKDIHELRLDGSHFNQRASERNIPDIVMQSLLYFNVDEWTLKTVEVRKDKGKFYNSTWEHVVNGTAYWVTIGLKDFIITIVRKDSSGALKCIKEGEYFDFVEKINRELMEAEKEKGS